MFVENSEQINHDIDWHKPIDVCYLASSTRFHCRKKILSHFALKASVVAMSGNDQAGSSNEGKGIASK